MEEYDLYLRKAQDMPYKQYLKTLEGLNVIS